MTMMSYREIALFRRALGGVMCLAMSALNFSASLAATEDPHRATKPDALLNRMAKVDMFACGGVGFGSATSEGEKDYRTLLSRPSAEADFERLFAVGNPQAKCYALVGLRQMNPKRSEALATSLQSSGIAVHVMRGCVMSKDPMSQIIKSIRAGIYSGPVTRDKIPPTH